MDLIILNYLTVVLCFIISINDIFFVFIFLICSNEKCEPSMGALLSTRRTNRQGPIHLWVAIVALYLKVGDIERVNLVTLQYFANSALQHIQLYLFSTKSIVSSDVDDEPPKSANYTISVFM
jgi:hypothetical protein